MTKQEVEKDLQAMTRVVARFDLCEEIKKENMRIISERVGFEVTSEMWSKLNETHDGKQIAYALVTYYILPEEDREELKLMMT